MNEEYGDRIPAGSHEASTVRPALRTPMLWRLARGTVILLILLPFAWTLREFWRMREGRRAGQDTVPTVGQVDPGTAIRQALGVGGIVSRGVDAAGSPTSPAQQRPMPDRGRPELDGCLGKVAAARVDVHGFTWVLSIDEARRLAREQGRAVFAVFDYLDRPGCPDCRSFDERICREPAVRQLLARFVLLRVYLDRMPVAGLSEEAQRAAADVLYADRFYVRNHLRIERREPSAAGPGQAIFRPRGLGRPTEPPKVYDDGPVRLMARHMHKYACWRVDGPHCERYFGALDCTAAQSPDPDCIWIMPEGHCRGPYSDAVRGFTAALGATLQGRRDVAPLASGPCVEAFRIGDFDGALRAVDAQLIRTPRSADLLLFRSLCLFARGGHDEAAGVLRSMEPADVERCWDWFALVKLYPDPGTYESHLRALESATANRLHEGPRRLLLAHHYLMLGLDEAAAGELTKVVGLEPGDTLARFLLAHLQTPPGASR